MLVAQVSTVRATDDDDNPAKIKLNDEDNHSGLHVETVYCLGNCALSPAALLDGAPVGLLDRDRIDAIVAAAHGKTQ